jgi:hypothetical protein
MNFQAYSVSSESSSGCRVWHVDGWSVDNLKTYKLKWIYVNDHFRRMLSYWRRSMFECIVVDSLKNMMKTSSSVASLGASFREGDLRNTEEEGDCSLGVLLQTTQTFRIVQRWPAYCKSPKVIQPELKRCLLTSGVYRLGGPWWICSNYYTYSYCGFSQRRLWRLLSSAMWCCFDW